MGGRREGLTQEAASDAAGWVSHVWANPAKFPGPQRPRECLNMIRSWGDHSNVCLPEFDQEKSRHGAVAQQDRKLESIPGLANASYPPGPIQCPSAEAEGQVQGKGERP